MNNLKNILFDPEIICRMCLGNVNKQETLDIIHCKALKDNPERIKMISNVFQTISLKLLDDHSFSKSMICNLCDERLLLMATFLEMCQQSDQLFKQEIIKTEVESDELIRFQLAASNNEFLKVDKGEVSESGESENIPLNWLLHTDIKKKLHSCSVCHKSFKSRVRLENHSYKHTGSPPHACQLCESKFRSQRTLKLHQQRDHQKDEKTEGKTQCKTKVADTTCNPSECLNVLSLITSNDFSVFSCDFCNKHFENKSTLGRHLKSHTKPYMCHCGKRFNRRQKLSEHDRVIHKLEDIRCFQCSDCGKRFRRNTLLSYHRNVHLGVKPYLCSACPEAYYSPAGLQQHQRRLHGPKRPTPRQRFLCDNCGASFSRQAHLNRHTLHRHTTDAPLAFSCSQCGKRFLDQDRLRAHVLTHTSERAFICKDCEKAFRTRNALQYHVNRVHIGLRPFPCTTCGNAFKCKSHLDKHIRTHTGEKPFSCPLCPYHCAEHGNLKKHLKIHERSR